MMLKKAAILQGETEKEKMLDFIIESNKVSLKKQKELSAVLYLENGSAWELYFIDNDSHEAKVSFWDDVLEYIRKNNINKFFIAGDYKITDIETGKSNDALVVTYADNKLTAEQYTIPYKRKFIKGIVFADMEKSGDVEMPYHESIFDYWENGNKTIEKGLKRHALSNGWKIYFPIQWSSEIDREDGHNIFCPENENPVIHISIMKPVKKDGSLSTPEELKQYATPDEYRLKRDDLRFDHELFTIDCFENNETIENGKALQSIQCSIVADRYLIFVTIAANEIQCCEQAVEHLRTLTRTK